MDDSFVAGFFDGEGNISLNKISKKQGKVRAYQVVIRFYNSDLNILEKIRDFLGCGKIYKSKIIEGRNILYELNIYSKSQVLSVLTRLSLHSISKKEKIDYILKHFNFGYDNNASFNVDEFHSMTTRKNVREFYVKKEMEIFQKIPCPICSKLFVKNRKKSACSDECTLKLKAKRASPNNY